MIVDVICITIMVSSQNINSPFNLQWDFIGCNLLLLRKIGTDCGKLKIQMPAFRMNQLGQIGNSIHLYGQANLRSLNHSWLPYTAPPSIDQNPFSRQNHYPPYPPLVSTYPTPLQYVPTEMHVPPQRFQINQPTIQTARPQKVSESDIASLTKQTAKMKLGRSSTKLKSQYNTRSSSVKSHFVQSAPHVPSLPPYIAENSVAKKTRSKTSVKHWTDKHGSAWEESGIYGPPKPWTTR